MMLRYCYSTDYASNTCVDHANMYAMGDKYDMQGLKLKAKENFAACLTVSIGDFITAIPVIYSSTPETDRGLRSEAAAYAADHWKALFEMPDFKKAITENADFVDDVVTERYSSAAADSPATKASLIVKLPHKARLRTPAEMYYAYSNSLLGRAPGDS